MSDSSEDELFASADEGSDRELDDMNLSNACRVTEKTYNPLEIPKKEMLKISPAVTDISLDSQQTSTNRLVSSDTRPSDENLLIDIIDTVVPVASPTAQTIVDVDLLLDTAVATASDGECLVPQRVFEVTDHKDPAPSTILSALDVPQETKTATSQNIDYLGKNSFLLASKSDDEGEGGWELEELEEEEEEETDVASTEEKQSVHPQGSVAVANSPQTAHIMDLPEMTASETLEGIPIKESVQQKRNDGDSFDVEKEKENEQQTSLEGQNRKLVEMPANLKVSAPVDDDVGDGWEVDDWDCVNADDPLPTVPPNEQSPTPPQLHEDNTSNSLPTPTASDLVKSLGGGLAMLVDSFSLTNLSSTMAAFDSASSCPPVNDEAAGEKANEEQHGWGWSNLGSLAKSFSSTVESTGLQLLHGGVDVLETIGKKTFTALKENDPGLVYTKRFLTAPNRRSQMPKLSQVLREAAANQHNHPGTTSAGTDVDDADAKRGDLVYQLDTRHALVHMEALELLSARASARLHTKITRLESTSSDISSFTSDGSVLDKIWQLLQLSDNEETEGCGLEEFSTALENLSPITPGAHLEKTHKELLTKRQEEDNDLQAKEIFYAAIGSLAESTTSILAYFHKFSECLLARPDRVTQGFLEIAKQVSTVLKSTRRLNENLCSISIDHLKQVDSEGSQGSTSKRCMADLFLEAGSANNYLGDAATCLIPIVQLVCVDSFFPEDQG